jgi:hypothetical protein
VAAAAGPADRERRRLALGSGQHAAEPRHVDGVRHDDDRLAGVAAQHGRQPGRADGHAVALLHGPDPLEALGLQLAKRLALIHADVERAPRQAARKDVVIGVIHHESARRPDRREPRFGQLAVRRLPEHALKDVAVERRRELTDAGGVLEVPEGRIA